MDNINVELLCLGNELLIGRTVNTNATKISLELSKLGYFVSRHTIIRDDLNTIVEELQFIRARMPNILVICGGLGPTYDDIQLECIAQALGREIVLNDNALNMIENKLKDRNIKLNDARKKMAMLPNGSIPLKNSVGTAPGVLTIVDNNYWISLPGVPREMNAILMEEVIPLLIDHFGKPGLVEYGFTVYDIPEAKIAHLSKSIMKKYPTVYIKTHPYRKKKRLWMNLHVYAIGKNQENVVKEASEFWKQEILKIGGTATEIKKVFVEDFEPEKYDFS